MIDVNGNRLIIFGAIVCALVLGSLQATAQEASRPNLNGIWNGTVTSIEHPLWTVEELFQCNCTPEAYEYLNELLHNPEYDHMSAEDIIDEVARFNEEQIATMYTDAGRAYAEAFDHANDPAIQCEYFGAFRTILHNDPILIEQTDDLVTIYPEDMASDRVIHMDGRSHPDNVLSPLGHSIGRYEGNTLVIETVGVSAAIADDSLSIHNTDGARSVERYSISEDGTHLVMDFTLIDPNTFTEPLTLRRTRIFTPDWAIEDAPCESISGQR
ncbi:MAG: hypothetical protein ACR2QQ_15605 [Gammaproteobacteria bacterium]